MAMDWPTHPRCSIRDGYSTGNISYGLAGIWVVNQNDIPLMRTLILHGREWWIVWMVRAIHMGHLEMLQALIDAAAWPDTFRRDDRISWDMIRYGGGEPFDTETLHTCGPLRRRATTSSLRVAIAYGNFDAFKMLYAAKHLRKDEPTAAELQKEAPKTSLIWWFLQARLPPAKEWVAIQ
jgi:hypothetical protein